MLPLANTDPQLTGLLGFASTLIQALGEWGVGALTFIETVFPPIPSEVILPLAGFEAHSGGMSVPLVIVTSVLGSYLGALLLYWLAAAVGQERVIRWLSHLPLVDREDFEGAARWFTRHGRSAVFFGRLVPGVRSLISLPAGAARMPLLQFSAFTLAGTVIWNGALIGAGWALGSQYHLVDQYSGVINYVLYAVIAVCVLLLVVRRVRRARAAKANRAP